MPKENNARDLQMFLRGGRYMGKQSMESFVAPERTEVDSSLDDDKNGLFFG